MLDNRLRALLAPVLERSAALLARGNAAPNHVTLSGFALAVPCFVALALGAHGIALLFLLLNRAADGLDGALARHLDAQGKPGTSDFGGYLDIVTDFVFYAGFVFFFAAGRPEFALQAAFLVFSFMGTASTFLAYAVLAQKRGISTDINGRKKTLYYLGGLTEGSETIAAFVLMCLWPDGFGLIAVVFGAACWVTAATRATAAWKAFG